MKAYRITPTEYHANTPSCFMFMNGEYFGDTVYAERDKFPQNVEHWHTATCSDIDRYFKVEEIEMPDYLLDWFRTTNAEIEEFRHWYSICPDHDKPAVRCQMYTIMHAQSMMINKL